MQRAKIFRSHQNPIIKHFKRLNYNRTGNGNAKPATLKYYYNPTENGNVTSAISVNAGLEKRIKPVTSLLFGPE